jgi:hypothetical protein
VQDVVKNTSNIRIVRYHENVSTHFVSGNRPTLHSCCLIQRCTIKMTVVEYSCQLDIHSAS